MYKDPDMMLGFAERIKTHPNPHTKYDKLWVGPLDPTSTVADLCSAINELVADAGLKVSMVSAPTQRIECEKDEDHPNGLKHGARTLWSSMLPGTKANLEKPWAALLLELTSTSDKWPTVDLPEDASKRTLYSKLTVAVQDDDGDDVTIPPIIIKIKQFEFVPYQERKVRSVAPWLVEQAAKKQRA